MGDLGLKAIGARIYFDTNILDAVYTLIKWEVGEGDKRFGESKNLDMEKNLSALFYVLDRGEEQWKMTFGTSELAKKEIDRIRLEKDPEYYREKVPDLYLAFETLRGLSSESSNRARERTGCPMRKRPR